MTSKRDDHAQGERPAVDARFRLTEPAAIFGGPVWASFEYRNVTSQPVSFSIGVSRSDGFRFVPIAPNVRALDPYHELGGLAPVIELEAGQAGSTSILVNRYLAFPSPGRYAIEAQVDFDVLDEQLAVIIRERVRNALDLELRAGPEKLADELAALERDAVAGTTRLTAIETLGELRSADALRILARVLDEGGETEIEAALVAIGRSGVPGAMEILDRFIATPTSPRLRDLARRARDGA